MSASADGAGAGSLVAAPGLAAAGFNVSGCLGARRYDALVPPAWRAEVLLPSTRTAIVLGAGGPGFFAAFRAAPEARLATDPVDAYTRRVAGELAAGLDGLALLACDRRGGVFADFVALAREAGLGAPSRLGLLLHPVFGPWMSLRALVLTPRVLAESHPAQGFDPCSGCPAPCAAACPGRALAGPRFDAAACAATRAQEAGCRSRCAARRACVVGRQHGYSAAAEAHHMAALDSP